MKYSLSKLQLNITSVQESLLAEKLTSLVISDITISRKNVLLYIENEQIQCRSTDSVTAKLSNKMLKTGIYNFSLGERETNNHTRHEKANNAAEVTQGQEIDRDRRTDGPTESKGASYQFNQKMT